MKRLLLCLTLLLALCAQEAKAQIQYYRTTKFAQATIKNGKYDWGEWKQSDMLLTIDLDEDVITIYSPEIQEYTVLSAYNDGEAYKDKEGGRNVKFSVFDQDLDLGEVRLRVDKDGTSQLYVDFANVGWVYNLVRGDGTFDDNKGLIKRKQRADLERFTEPVGGEPKKTTRTETSKAKQKASTAVPQKPADKAKEDIMEDENGICPSPDTQAAFPGGSVRMMQFIAARIVYPEACKKKGISGRVITKITIEKDGSIGNVDVQSSPNEELSFEARRVIKNMPKWTPAKKNGKEVRTNVTIPVSFKL